LDNYFIVEVGSPAQITLAHGRFMGSVKISCNSNNPLAVSMTVLCNEDEAKWTFARSLLEIGMFQLTGEGRVKVHPALDGGGNPVANITLRSETDIAYINIPMLAVINFFSLSNIITTPEITQARLDYEINNLFVG
jgi:hypothetical protein